MLNEGFFYQTERKLKRCESWLSIFRVATGISVRTLNFRVKAAAS